MTEQTLNENQQKIKRYTGKQVATAMSYLELTKANPDIKKGIKRIIWDLGEYAVSLEGKSNV